MNTADNSLAVPLLATGVYGCVNVIATIQTMIFIDNTTFIEYSEIWNKLCCNDKCFVQWKLLWKYLEMKDVKDLFLFDCSYEIYFNNVYERV